jgi:hypothetical protein
MEESSKSLRIWLERMLKESSWLVVERSYSRTFFSP